MGGAPAQTGVKFGVIRRLFDRARPDGKNKMDDQKPAPVKLSFRSGACSTAPGFKPIEDYHADVAAKIAAHGQALAGG